MSGPRNLVMEGIASAARLRFVRARKAIHSRES
jgi:hypothetical protein